MVDVNAVWVVVMYVLYKTLSFEDLFESESGCGLTTWHAAALVEEMLVIAGDSTQGSETTHPHFDNCMLVSVKRQ